MVTIFTPLSWLDTINQLISSEERLHEVVTVAQLSSDFQVDRFLIVENNRIQTSIPWHNQSPPYLLPFGVEWSGENLLALVYTQLTNFEKAYHFSVDNPALNHEIDLLNCLQHGIAITLPDPPDTFGDAWAEYRFWHNAAVLAQYGETRFIVHHSLIRRYYERAFDLAFSDELRAFTGKHWATFLMDTDELAQAESILEDCLALPISEVAKVELQNSIYGVWLKQLVAPYDPTLLTKIQDTIWNVLQYYEQRNNLAQTALVLIDASQVANFLDSFSESLGYINRAIQLLEEEPYPELVANAQFRKGTLLFTWAQNGNPSFYRPAMNAYQKAVKVFSKENTPEVFAEIQHQLAIIYSEIPDEVQKKSVWASVSISSFKEALRYYTRETHPYEYARICNHYANALTKFPEAKLSDNYAKAINLYREALDIRTAEEYPYERAMTLLNFLEAAWHVSVPEPEQQNALFSEMKSYALEIPTLVPDAKFWDEARKHLEALQDLILDT